MKNLWIALLVIISPVQAGPPFVTDDPEPVDLHHWEVYLASTYTHFSHSDVASLPMLEVNYGALPDLQLHMIPQAVYDHESGEASHYGVGDLELGCKYRFIHETDRIPQVGIFPLVELPAGDSHLNLGSGKVEVFIPVWIQKSFGPWTSYGGGGFWSNPAGRDFWRVGWELQRDLNEHLTLGAEIYHETSAERGDDGHTAFNVGGIVNFDEHQHLLMSAGRDLDGPDRFSCYVGFQWTY